MYTAQHLPTLSLTDTLPLSVSRSVLHDQGGLTTEQKTVLARKENEIAAARTRTKPKAGGARKMSVWQQQADQSQLASLS